jgi:hypothetical protein
MTTKVIEPKSTLDSSRAGSWCRAAQSNQSSPLATARDHTTVETPATFLVRCERCI